MVCSRVRKIAVLLQFQDFESCFKMSKILKSKSGWENRIYIGTRSVFSCHVETVVLLSKKKATDFVEIGVDAEDYYRIKEKSVIGANC